MRGIRAKERFRHLNGSVLSLLLIWFAPLAAKTVTLTPTPSDTQAVIADLQPLFGLPWRLLCTPSATALDAYVSDFIDGENGFLCTLKPQSSPACELWRYERGRWQRVDLGTHAQRPMNALFARTRNDIWLSFNPGTTIKQDLLHFDGHTWRHVPTPNSDRIRCIFMLSPTSGWAGCEWGQIMHYDGHSWQLVPSPVGSHLLALFMASDSSGLAWTKTHRKQSYPLLNDGGNWRMAPSDSISLLQLLVGAMMPEMPMASWPIEILKRFSWLQRPAAVTDTLVLDSPLALGQLLFCHHSGAFYTGHLARAWNSAGSSWIANLIEEEHQDSSHVWQKISFYNLEGEKRCLIIRVPLQRRLPALFFTTYLQSSWYVGEHGLAVADFNGDGIEDLFAVATGAANHLFLLSGNRGGIVESETAAAAGLAGMVSLPTGVINYDEGCSAADVDNDGDQDLVVTSLYGQNLLYRQMHRGHFREESAFAGLDNCLARSCSAIWADVNGDGAVDLYVSNEDSTNRLYLNNGAGIFRDVTRKAGLLIDRGGGGSAFGDIDDDGDPDLFVPRYGQPNLLYLNQGASSPGAIPSFRECGREAGVTGSDTLDRSTSATWGDVDNDGDLDLFVTNLIHSNQLYLNDGRGRFTEVTAARGLLSRDLSQTALLLDADNDGDLDLLTGNRGLNRFYTNQGKGFFHEATREAGLFRPTISAGMAALDLENDGDLDIYLAQDAERSGLYDNLTNNHRWLKVQLQGDRSNRDAIGARLWLYRDGHLGEPEYLLGMREINGGSGYNSMSSRIVHFGLPDEGRLALRVRFPAGTVRELSGLLPGQLFEIRESLGWQHKRALLAKWLQRFRANPEPRLPLALLLIFSSLILLVELYHLHFKSWPARTLGLMVLLPGLLMLLLLVVLTGQPAGLRYSLGVSLPLIAWALALAMYRSRIENSTHAIADLEKLYLALSAFFHGEWAARKLNRIELYSQNLTGDQPRSDEVVSAFMGVIDDYFSMLVPELEKILELASGSHTPDHLRGALKTAMLNLTAALSALKVELRLGSGESLPTVVRRSQILQMELQALRKQVAERFSCQVRPVVEKVLEQNRRPDVSYTLDPAGENEWRARIPGYTLSQILENLLDNAHAALKDTPRKAVGLKVEANADYLFLHIRDNGPGVPDALARRLFNERVSTKPGGGFGLYNAYQELIKYGGAIRLCATPAGQGALFEIMLKRIDHE